jgi:hypothetical protein
MIAKHLIKILPSKDERRVQFNQELDRLNSELSVLSPKPDWVIKHHKGVDAVLGFSVFWAIVLAPIEALAMDERNKAQERLLKKFYGFMKQAQISDATIKHPVGTSLVARLEAMKHLNVS